MDGSKLVRETWRQRKGTESGSGKSTWRSREKITERTARGKKATTEQNESEEAWKEGGGRKMSTLGREGPSSKIKIYKIEESFWLDSSEHQSRTRHYT